MRLSTVFPSLIERLAKAVGWSPIGKPVCFLIDEAQDFSKVGARLVGVLDSLNPDGSATVTTAAGLSLKLVPRHSGFGFYYLKVGQIAAYQVADSAAGDPRIVQGMLSLV